MEPLFENRYYSDYKMIVEFARKHMHGPKVLFMVIFWLLYGIILGLYLMDMTDYEGLSTIIGLGVCMLIITFMPNWFAWLTIRQTKKQNDGVMPECVVTFGDTIEIREGMVHLTVEYRKIQKVVRLKHSYVLKNGKRNGILLAIDGFTKGTFADFKQFLKEKRPDLQIPE